MSSHDFRLICICHQPVAITMIKPFWFVYMWYILVREGMCECVCRAIIFLYNKNLLFWFVELPLSECNAQYRKSDTLETISNLYSDLNIHQLSWIACHVLYYCDVLNWLHKYSDIPDGYVQVFICGFSSVKACSIRISQQYTCFNKKEWHSLLFLKYSLWLITTIALVYPQNLCYKP